MAGEQFFGKWADAFANTLWANNSAKIALSHTISEINVFRLCTEFKHICQKWQENNFWGKWADCRYIYHQG